MRGPTVVAPRRPLISTTVSVPRKSPVVPGTTVPIRGKTSRRLAGQAIDLRTWFSSQPFRPLRGAGSKIARVRVAPDGSFACNHWRPARVGTSSVVAVHDSHDPHFVDTTTSGCFPVVRVLPAAR